MERVLKVIRLTNLHGKLGFVYGSTTEDRERLSDLEGANMDMFENVLAQAKTLVGGWGGILYFVYLPTWDHFSGRPGIGPKQRASVLARVANVGITVIDIYSVFERQPEPLLLFPFGGRVSGHYNEAGHRLVADTVLKIISSGTQQAGAGPSKS
jgi:hypothetical protein